MRLKTLQMTNIGKYFQELLVFPEKTVTAILGENGAGKSTIFDAILYALFGKTSKESSKDEIITVGAEEGEVTLSLYDDNHQYTITRSRSVKKQKTEVVFIVDEKNISGATIDETDRTIQQILHIDYATFRNSISFAQGEVSQFVLGTDKERKDILSAFLNLEIYDKALIQVRQKLVEVNHQVDQLIQQKQSIEASQVQVEQARVQLEQLQLMKDKEEKDFQKLLKDASSTQVGVVVDTKDIELKLAVIEGYKSAREKIQGYYQSVQSHEYELNGIRKELQRISGEAFPALCPTCYQEFTREAQEAAKKTLIKKGNAIKRDMDVMIADLGVEQIKTITDLAKHLRDLNVEIEKETSLRQEKMKIEMNAKIRANTDNVEKLTFHHNQQLAQLSSHIAIQQAIIQNSDDMSIKLASLNILLDTYLKTQERYRCLEQAFGVNGIRTMIFENIIPVLEQKINFYVSALSSDILVSLDTQVIGKTGVTKEKFAIYIQDGEGKREFRTYSGGEKRVIAVAFRLAFAELALELANNKFQFLLLDEVTDTLDSNKKEQLFKMLMQLSQRFQQIFIISHDSNFQDLFTSIWRVVKTNGESKVIQ